MKPLANDLQQRLDSALDAAAAGRVGHLVEIADSRPEGAASADEARVVCTTDALRVVSSTGDRMWIARPRAAPAPEWWDCDDTRSTLDALGGLLTSTFLEVHLLGASGLAEVPVPELTRKRAAQLAVLFRAFSRADAHGRAALRGSLDRCVADMYGLSLQLLIEIEQHIEPQEPLSSP